MGFAFHQLCLLQWNSNPLLPLRLLGYGTPLPFLVTPYSICMVKIKKKKKKKKTEEKTETKNASWGI